MAAALERGQPAASIMAVMQKEEPVRINLPNGLGEKGDDNKIEENS